MYTRMFVFVGLKYLLVSAGFLKCFSYHYLREWRQHRRHGYVTTYHRQRVTAAAVLRGTDSGSVVKVPVSATQAMQLHSRPLFHANAAIEELIRELLGEWPFLTPALCQPHSHTESESRRSPATRGRSCLDHSACSQSWSWSLVK